MSSPVVLTLLWFSEKASDEEWKLLWYEESLPPRWFRRLIGISQCRYDALPWGFVAVVPFSLSLQVKERGSGSVCSCRSVPVFLLSVKALVLIVVEAVISLEAFTDS
ncbi:hypothetical protein YC2023_056231 [Brassica napus]